MTFLNPTILWGLLAVLVPIIVHFFNLQRPKVILFSNIDFVKEVKKNVVRRLKLRQWLLLLARILAVVGLVLAFAHPVIVNEKNKMLAGNRSVAIVIDNSYSMSGGNEKGAYLQQAISLTKNIVNSYSPQDEFLLMTTGNMRLNHNFGEKDEVLDELQKLDFKQKVRTQGEILNFTDEIFARSGSKIKEMYFISDFQVSTVMADSLKMALQDTNLLIKFIPLATREQKNVYITDHKITSQIIERNKPVQMTLSLVNDGEEKVNDLGVRVLIDEKVVSIGSYSVEPRSKQEITVSFSPAASGWQSGYISLDDYPIEFDNKRYFSFYVPDKEKVLVVEGNKSPNIHILYQDLFPQFAPTFVGARDISTVQFSDYRAVIIAGLGDASSGLTEKVTNFLKEGGNMMVFPASNMNLTSVNALYQSLNVGRFSDLANVQGGSKASVVALEHPIFEGVFLGNQKNREFDAPNLFRYYPFEISTSSIQNKILSLENQSPVFFETKVGNGTLFTWTTFPGDAWTDLHVKTVFPPMMFRATQLMCKAKGENVNQELGHFANMSVHTAKQELIKLKGDKDAEYIPEQYQQGDATVLKFDKLDIKEGNYRVIQGEGEEQTELDRVSFNIADRESKLAFTDKDGVEDRLEKAGISSVQVLTADSHAITSTVKIEKEGTPLWKYFVSLALLMLIAEIAILRFRDGTWGKPKEEV